MQLSYQNFCLNFKNLLALTNKSYPHTYGNNIAVAVSGGADSMCLASLLNKYCNEYGLSLFAIIVDHQLRKESKSEAIKTKNFLKRHNISTFIQIWNKKEEILNNIHAKARKARYKLLLEFCIKHKIELLCTAHTKDDQAETVFMRIARGSGIDGISGIPEIKSLNSIILLRPLLNFTRKQIEDYLLSISWTWINDQSNLNRRFERVKIRSFLSAFHDKELLKERLFLLSKNAKRTRNFLENHTSKVFKTICKINDYGFISMSKSQFAKLDEEIALRILNYILKNIGGNEYNVRLTSVSLLLKQLMNNELRSRTLAGCHIIAKKTDVIFFREQYFITKQKTLIPGIFNIWDNRYKIYINSSGFFVTYLSEDIWHQIKPKNFTHNLPDPKIIFTTPVIISEDSKMIIHPIFDIIKNNKKNIPKVEILHIFKQ